MKTFKTVLVAEGRKMDVRDQLLNQALEIERNKTLPIEQQQVGRGLFHWSCEEPTSYFPRKANVKIRIEVEIEYDENASKHDDDDE